MKYFALLFALLVGSAFGQSVSSAVSQVNIHQTICVRGYTATVRPPLSVSRKLKRELLREKGIPVSQSHLYTLDHIVPLELGGLPADRNNLQLQLVEPAHEKDLQENAHRRAVCSGRETLAQGQAAFQ